PPRSSLFPSTTLFRSGLAVIRGEPVVPRPRDGREKRLLVSALQSSLFNEVLARRLADGTFAQVIEGDVLRKVETGGSFVTPDPRSEEHTSELQSPDHL